MSFYTFEWLFVLIAITTTVQCQTVDIIKFDNHNFLEIGDACTSWLDGIQTEGVCKSIKSCPSVLSNVLDRISSNRLPTNHTVCGYQDKTQIICCPVTTKSSAIQLEQPTKLDLRETLECTVANSYETGIIKFLSDCPHLNQQVDGEHTNKLCKSEICSDLVCCPVRAPLLGRLKNVCEKVDHPSEELELRLLLNQECTVSGLNIKGRYQKYKCDFAERNPDLLPMLQNVCNDEICNNWYCCPIEDGDMFQCSGNQVADTTALLVGPKCIDSKTRKRGTCKQSYNCMHPDVYNLDKCGSYCCNDYYCCPDDLGDVNESISVRECNKYSKYVSQEEIEVPMNLYVNRSDCPIITFVAGGVIANPGEFPHMAALGYRSLDEILWKCGGSLISNRYVLTAGHCLSDDKLGSVQKVRLGVVDLLNDVKTADCPEDFDVANIIPHPEYNSRFVYNDIGLIELTAEVKYNFHIRPICLPPSANVEQYYESMGWGATGTVEETSQKLIKADQEIFTFEDCQKQYNVGRRFPDGIVNDTQICAGSKNDIQSTCPGDSGGPLLVHQLNYKLFYIHGIVSFGTACGFINSPGVYTRVFPFVKWIEGIVWRN